jgi:transmembrane sensor
VKQDKKHIIISLADEQSKKFFSGGTFIWKKSKDDVWSEIESALAKKPARKMTLNVGFSKWTVAASIVLLVGLVSFMRFYTKDIHTDAGAHLLVQLPDKSTVNLNAQSSVEFHPYWWRFKREVKFEGEGYFEVEKGKQFTVLSKLGTTKVLGTSFNIFSREEVYKVVCLTGKVKVTSKSKDEVVLHPNSKASIQKNGKIDVFKDIEALPEISWKNNLFLFTASPIRDVFKEIERQYGVTILANIDSYVLYTGNFTKDQNVDEILGYICPALGYKFVNKSKNVYYIIPSNE